MLPKILPMRLTRIAKPFDDPDYIFELKHDGFRAIAYIENSTCRIVSRNLNHFKSFDLLKKSLEKLPVQNAILDGEVGRPSATGSLSCTVVWRIRKTVERSDGKCLNPRILRPCDRPTFVQSVFFATQRELTLSFMMLAVKRLLRGRAIPGWRTAW